MACTGARRDDDIDDKLVVDSLKDEPLLAEADILETEALRLDDTLALDS